MPVTRHVEIELALKLGAPFVEKPHDASSDVAEADESEISEHVLGDRSKESGGGSSGTSQAFTLSASTI